MAKLFREYSIYTVECGNRRNLGRMMGFSASDAIRRAKLSDPEWYGGFKLEAQLVGGAR